MDDQDLLMKYLRAMLHQSRVSTPEPPPRPPVYANPDDWDGLPAEPTEEFWTPQTVFGWRHYTLGLDMYSVEGGHWVLRGARANTWLTPALEAECLSWIAAGEHQAPDWECECGIYVSKDVSSLIGREQFGVFPPIYASVKATGLIIEHEHGYRAQHVEVDKILVSTSQLLKNETVGDPAYWAEAYAHVEILEYRNLKDFYYLIQSIEDEREEVQ